MVSHAEQVKQLTYDISMIYYLDKLTSLDELYGQQYVPHLKGRP
jgi:hypothetical protein